MGLEIFSVIFFPLKLRKNSHNLLKKALNLDLMVHKMSSFANLLITLLILWPGSCTLACRINGQEAIIVLPMEFPKKHNGPGLQ